MMGTIVSPNKILLRWFEASGLPLVGSLWMLKPGGDGVKDPGIYPFSKDVKLPMWYQTRRFQELWYKFAFWGSP